MTNRDDFEGLLTAIIVSWVVVLALWLAGKVLPSLGQGNGRKAQNLNNTTSPPDFKFLKNSPTIYEMNPLVWLFGEALAFPLFYTFFFAALPAIIVIFSKKLLEDEVKEAFFFDSRDDQDLKIEQILIWLAVYCFCGAMFSVLLSCLQAIPTKYENDALFERFPFQYNDKIFTQFAVIGSFLLLGALASASKIVDADLVEDDLLNLMRAGVCAPWALLIKIGYQGFTKIFDSLFIGTLPGINLIHVLGHLTASALLLRYISETNDIAMYCFMVSAVAFVAFPNLFWILSCSRMKVVLVDEENAQSRIKQWQHEPAVDTFQVQFNVLGKPSNIGLKHSVWKASKPWLSSISAFFFTVPTESDTTATLISSKTMVEPTFPDPDWACVLKPITTPIILPFILLAISVHYFREPKGKLLTQIGGGRSLGTVLLSPPMGRSVFHLLAEFNQCIYFVDGPGIVPALGYFNRYAASVAKGIDGIHKAFFVFKCNSNLDFCTLAHGLESILSTHRIPLGEQRLDFFIISSTNRVSELKFQDRLAEERRLISDRLVNTGRTWGIVDLSKLCAIEGAKQTALVSIGSSTLSHISRRMTKSSVVTRKMKVFPVVFEDSIYRMPVQTSPY